MNGVIRAVREAWCWMRGRPEPPTSDPTPIRQWLAEQEADSRQATVQHRQRKQNAMERLAREARRGYQ